MVIFLSLVYFCVYNFDLLFLICFERNTNICPQRDIWTAVWIWCNSLNLCSSDSTTISNLRSLSKHSIDSVKINYIHFPFFFCSIIRLFSNRVHILLFCLTRILYKRNHVLDFMQIEECTEFLNQLILSRFWRTSS